MNPARGEAAIELAGTTVTLRPSFAALVAAEQEIGSLFALVERAAAGTLSLSEMVALFWHCARENAALTGKLRGSGRLRRPGQCHTGAARADRPDPAGTMSTRFADVAARLAGMAGVIAGWRPDDFWRATPAELGCVIRAIAGDGESTAGSLDLKRLQEMFPDG